MQRNKRECATDITINQTTDNRLCEMHAYIDTYYVV